MTQLYFVKPKDKFSYSRRWNVDEYGLEKVTNHYKNYKKDESDPTIDRWSDFIVEEINEIYFDFGGMIHVHTPDIKIKFDPNNTVSCPVTHYPTLLHVLKDFHKKGKDSWQMGTRFFNYILGSKVAINIMNALEEKKHIYEEMIEGFEKATDEAALNAGVIRIKRKG